jgi:FkbM family methyltransferase
MQAIKSFVRSAIRITGYDVHKLVPGEPGSDPYLDMRRLVGRSQRDVTIFDVGANIGQTIQRLRETFSRPTIHAFEPGSDAFGALWENCSRLADVRINNIALGSRSGTREFIENTWLDLSSFLEPGEECWGKIKQRTRVEITTIDDYCSRHCVDRIDILKSDTQGFDLEVLKGAVRLFAQNRIHLVYLEINFGKLYRNATRLGEIYDFLTGRDFDLVSFYKIYYINGLAKWTDALFVNQHYDPNAY